MFEGAEPTLWGRPAPPRPAPPFPGPGSFVLEGGGEVIWLRGRSLCSGRKRSPAPPRPVLGPFGQARGDTARAVSARPCVASRPEPTKRPGVSPRFSRDVSESVGWRSPSVWGRRAPAAPRPPLRTGLGSGQRGHHIGGSRCPGSTAAASASRTPGRCGGAPSAHWRNQRQTRGSTHGFLRRGGRRGPAHPPAEAWRSVPPVCELQQRGRRVDPQAHWPPGGRAPGAEGVPARAGLHARQERAGEHGGLHPAEPEGAAGAERGLCAKPLVPPGGRPVPRGLLPGEEAGPPRPAAALPGPAASQPPDLPGGHGWPLLPEAGAAPVHPQPAPGAPPGPALGPRPLQWEGPADPGLHQQGQPALVEGGQLQHAGRAGPPEGGAGGPRAVQASRGHPEWCALAPLLPALPGLQDHPRHRPDSPLCGFGVLTLGVGDPGAPASSAVPRNQRQCIFLPLFHDLKRQHPVLAPKVFQEDPAGAGVPRWGGQPAAGAALGAHGLRDQEQALLRVRAAGRLQADLPGRPRWRGRVPGGHPAVRVQLRLLPRPFALPSLGGGRGGPGPPGGGPVLLPVCDSAAEETRGGRGEPRVTV